MRQDTDLATQMAENGDLDRLRELLRKRLQESGWREEMKAYCREIVREKGVENVNVDDLVRDMTHKGRELVPESVKREMLQRIRSLLEYDTFGKN